MAPEKPRDENPHAPARTPGRRVIGLELVAVRELGSRFLVSRPIDSGHGAALFAARDATTGQTVALQLIDLQILRASSLEEAMRAAVSRRTRLDHPHIVPVLSSGTTTSLFWYTSPLHAEYRTLATKIEREGPLPLTAMLRIMEQATSGLHYAHSRSIAHGAVNANSILVSDSGWALVSGFCTGNILRQLASARTSRDDAPTESVDAAVLRASTPHDDQRDLAVCIGECTNDRTPEHFRAALSRATNPDPANRFAGVLELMAALGRAEVATQVQGRIPPQPSHEQSHDVLFIERPDAPRRWLPSPRVMVAALGLCALVALATAVGRRYSSVDRPYVDPAIVQSAYGTSAAGTLDRKSDFVLPDTITSASSASSTVDTTARVAASERPAATPDKNRSAAISEGVATKTAPPAPRTTPVKTDAAPPVTPVVIPPGFLSVSSRPWAYIYIDGARVGNTPMRAISLSAGSHTIRLEREGFRSFETQITVSAGATMRLTDILLERNGS